MDTPAALPELPDSLEWLNCAKGTLREQRGRVVALAFVNAGSVWCLQRLVELAQWQARFGGRLQAIAIHVPRSDCERDPAFVRKQMRRNGVSLPMALDRDWIAWQQFGLRAWPTVMLIDADGRLQARAVGQDGLAELEKTAAALCEALPPPNEGDARGQPETEPEPRLPLRFPAGLAVNGECLFIADSGNHRVLECNLDGRVLRRFGMGTADFIDGDGELAAFRHPQALALTRESLYVADTGNHALRRIGLRSGHVDTLCGTGRPGDTPEGEIREPRSVALNHPVGLVANDRELLLAQAGDNRIWRYDLASRRLESLTGSGQLELRDGAGAMAAFAQPVGLAAVQQVLYVCDALGSAVRSLQLRSGLVQTLVGQGLWEYGNADGPRERARLQYPQAIALSPSAPMLFVADAGNGCLRMLRLGGGVLSTLELPRRLDGPAGLAMSADGRIWIAETHAHQVLRFDPATGELVRVPVDEA
ncbi:MAG: hypothetical protein QM599_11780 [Pseudoxanthomonas sp.]